MKMAGFRKNNNGESFEILRDQKCNRITSKTSKLERRPAARLFKIVIVAYTGGGRSINSTVAF